MEPTTYGVKYDANLSTAQIAALVRADIKAAVKAKSLPRAKYSVRIATGTLYASIRVRVSRLPFPTRATREFVMPAKVGFTPEAWAVRSTLDAMLGAYNYDGSDVQTDHFDVNFYGDVVIESTYADADPALIARCHDAAASMTAPAPSCVAATGWDDLEAAS